MLYSSIYSCKFGNNAATLQAPAAIMETLHAAADNAVAIMHFNYQTLNTERVGGAHCTAQNGKNKI
jgi:antitoxin component of MazEF toxin-antitoxin module